MKHLRELEQDIKKLAMIVETKGIQISELADNLYEGHYQSITIKKTKNGIIADLYFHDEIDGKKQIAKMRYTYTKERTLMMIEEISGKKKHTLWNRESFVKELVDEVVKGMRLYLNKKEKKKFIKGLPLEVRAYFEDKKLYKEKRNV